MQKFGTKVSEFIVVLKPSPFGPDPHFRHLRIEPQFDNVTAYFRSGHIELGFLRTPPVQIGDTNLRGVDHLMSYIAIVPIHEGS